MFTTPGVVMGEVATPAPAHPANVATLRFANPGVGVAWGSWGAGAALTVGLAVCIQVTSGWRPLLAAWLALPVGSLAGACVLLFASYAVRTLRIHRYFESDVRGHFLSTLRVVGVHNLLNNLLPIRSGEASFPILMRRDFGVPLSKSVPGLMYLRLLDFHVIVLASVGLITWSWGPWRWLAVASVLVLPPLGFWSQEYLRSRLVGSNRLTRVIVTGLSGFPRTFAQFGRIWLWTGANWVTKLAVLVYVLTGFVSVSWGDALLGSIVGELSSVLPIHGIAGAGTYEGAVVAGLVASGNPAEEMLTGAVSLHLFVLGASVLGGLLVLLLPRGPGDRSAIPPVRANLR